MDGIALFPIVAGLVGGLALFLLGMDLLSTGLRTLTGHRMKAILARVAGRPVLGALTGAGVTAVIQSSSVTTVLVVSLISASVMTLPQSVGVIMGANIGTTITAQIIAFKVTAIALPLVALGFGAQFFGRNERLRQWGGMILGLGLVFYGMVVMSDAMAPLRDYPPFIDLMVRMDSPVAALLVGAAFTALVQSSSATTGLVIVLAGQDLISLQAGIVLVLGANVGTCVTALLAAIGKPRPAVQAALVHVIFNVLGVVLWLPFVPELAQVARFLAFGDGSHVSGLVAGPVLGPDVPRMIANAHTLFNVVNTALFLGFAGAMARLVQALVPESPATAPAVRFPDHLRPELQSTAALALDAARQQVGDLGVRVTATVDQAVYAALHADRDALTALTQAEETINAEHAHLLRYLQTLGGHSLASADSRTLLTLIQVSLTLESIGDVVISDFVSVGEKRLAEGFTVTPATSDRLLALQRQVADAVRMTVHAVLDNDAVAARAVVAMKPRVRQQAEAVVTLASGHLLQGPSARVAAYNREMECVEGLRRIYTSAKRVAHTLRGETVSA